METKKPNLLLGGLGVLGIWLSAGIGLPLVNYLRPWFTAEQLLAARGWIPAVLTFLILRTKVFRADWYTYLIGVFVPFAAWSLFRGSRAWGVGPTIIIITATPLVNFAFTLVQGKRVPKAAVLATALMIFGVATARWGGHFQLEGFLWSMAAVFLNGIIYELFDRAQSPLLTRCFWGSVGIGTLGLVGSVNVNWQPVFNSHELTGVLLAYAFIHGFVYWIANLWAFDNLDKNVASVLAQGETPATIIVAWLLLGEKLTLVQWLGVFVALYGVYQLQTWLKKPTEE